MIRKRSAESLVAEAVESVFPPTYLAFFSQSALTAPISTPTLSLFLASQDAIEVM